LFDRGGVSKPSKSPMLAARVYRPLIMGAGLTMGERKRREEKSKEIKRTFQ
jgi:hypothetical protein